MYLVQNFFRLHLTALLEQKCKTVGKNEKTYERIVSSVLDASRNRIN